MTAERLTFGHGSHGAVPHQAGVAAGPDAREPEVAHVAPMDTWDWAWGGLLLFTVILFFRPQDQIPGLSSLHIADLAALLGLAALAFQQLSRGRPLTRVTPELLGILALGAVILATIPTSFWMGGAFEVFHSLYVPIALIFMLMVNTLTSPARVERISRIIVLAFGYMSALVIFNYMRGVGLVEGNRATGPVGGFFSNPNDLALNLAAFLPFALMYVRRPGPAGMRLLCAGISVLMLVAIVCTKSRSGTLGTVAMLVSFVIVARLLTPALIIGTLIGGMVITPILPDAFWHRIASITDAAKDETGSREERTLLLGQAWTVFLDNPLTGVGAGQFKNYYRPGLATRWHEAHNVILQVGAEIGIVGVVVFVFLIVRAFSASWWTRRQLSWIHHRRSRHRPVETPGDGLEAAERRLLESHASAAIAGLVGWFVCAMFASVALNWTFYYLLGLSVTARDVVVARERAWDRARAAARDGVAA